MKNNVTYIPNTKVEEFDFDNGFTFEIFDEELSHEAWVINHKLIESFNNMKLVLVFRLLIDEKDIYLPKYYNLSSKKRTGFIPGFKTLLFRDCVRLFGITKSDFPHMDIQQIIHMFYGKSFSVSLRTAEEDFRKRPLPKAAQYSLVNEISLFQNKR